MARPVDFAGGVTMGVREYPGFHTAANKETTYAYAQQKAVSERFDTDLNVDEVAEITIEDYPVVVTLDMAGMKRHVDYDAVEMVKPVLVNVAQEVIGEAMREGKDPVEILIQYTEWGEEGRETSMTAMEWLFEYGSSVITEPSSALLAFVEGDDDPSEFLRQLADNQIPDEDLAEITGQFRYVDDVSSSRIVVIEYLQPWWPNILDWETDEGDMELGEVLEKKGWSVVGLDDVMSFTLNEDMRTVYQHAEPKNARIEYHGTTYLNLLSAAPHLDLPVPPHPFAVD